MTRKNKTQRQKKPASTARIAQLEKKLKTISLKKATPFADTGAVLGRAAGSIFGHQSVGASVGKWLGSGIGSIFGSGDYKMLGDKPKYNVFSGQIPKFTTGKATNIVCHREFLGNITGTSAFTNTTYPIQPGSGASFPWLASVAASYQEYRIHGLVYEFNPLITDFITGGAPGVLVMATNYNADSLPYASKIAMENSEYAVAVKPTEKLMHMVECATAQTILPERFIRTGPAPLGQDLRLYDLGNFQIATQGNPVQLLGELWVTYCVELFKPILPTAVSLSEGGNADHFRRGNLTNGSNFPLGTIDYGVTNSTIGCTLSGARITFPAAAFGTYYINVYWNGTTNAVGVPYAVGFNNCSAINAFQASSPSPGTLGTVDAVGSTQPLCSSVTIISIPGGAQASIDFNATATYPAGNIDIFVIELPTGFY